MLKTEQDGSDTSVVIERVESGHPSAEGVERLCATTGCANGG